ncbi:MAG: hypothetical protein KGI80_00045 [Verrucomicrobiota bacterium]|nr:hypothetical protein [Verrucomicrobiota bacterium]
MRCFRFKCRFLLFFPFLAEAISPPPHVEEQVQTWFSGTILSISPYSLTPGQVNIEPFLFTIANTAVYDSHWHKQSIPTLWNNKLEIFAGVGIAPCFDIYIDPTFWWNYCEGSAHWEIGDFPLFLEFQLYRSAPTDWAPSIKLDLIEVFPTGSYQHFDPKANLTQLSGTGSWQTALWLIAGNLVHLSGIHYMNYRILLSYSIASPVHVSGFNAYGGGFGADARVFPGQSFFVLSSFEWGLTKNWAFALDLFSIWQTRIRYSGFPGTVVPLNSTKYAALTAAGKSPLAPLGSGSSAQFSMIPALEYNWNANLGMLVASWFTVGGRNAPAFTSGVVAVNINL